MKRGLVVLAAVLALAVWGRPASAAGYDDFAIGMSAMTEGKTDVAIASFTAALKSPDLAPAYIPTAYRGRARALVIAGKCHEALADVEAAAALRPLNASGYFLRAHVKICLKDTTGAQADFDTALGPEPDAFLYWEFGRELWDAGMFDEAHKNLLRSTGLFDKKKKNSHMSYTILWYAITADRLGHLDIELLAKLADVYVPSDWPYALIKLYLGKLTPEQVRDRIASLNSDDRRNQQCEADFYIGQWYLVHGNPEAGKAATAAAVAGCPKEFVEYGAAVVEAKRLGLPVAKEDSK